MFTALRLAESGIAVQLIDQESRTAGRSYACALHPRTLQLLDEAGVAREAIQRGQRIETVGLLRRRPAARGSQAVPVAGGFPFVLVLPQSSLEDLLEKKLKERCGVKVHWNHRLADLAMKDGAAIASIEEMALAGKGYIVPGFESGGEKNCVGSRGFRGGRGRPEFHRPAAARHRHASRRGRRSFSPFTNWKRRRNFRRK